jgi:hypothetical protein
MKPSSAFELSWKNENDPFLPVGLNNGGARCSLFAAHFAFDGNRFARLRDDAANWRLPVTATVVGIVDGAVSDISDYHSSALRTLGTREPRFYGVGVVSAARQKREENGCG